MRRSFGGGGSMGRGCGGGGGGMLRSVQRAFRSGVGAGGAPPEPFSPSGNSTTIATSNSRKGKQINEHQSPPPNTALTLSSSSGGPNVNDNNNKNGQPAFSTLINHPESGAPGAAAIAWGSCSDIDDMKWECLDANDEHEKAFVLHEDFVFGTVPSGDEVNCAISALQQVFGPSSHSDNAKDVYNQDNRTGRFEKISSLSESEVDWIEPSLNIRNSRMSQPYEPDRVYDAFYLLQSEPSVQRMVMALSSDKAVWDAVLNNEVVKELRGSISQGDSSDKASDDESNLVKDVLCWVFVNTKAKIMQLINKITELANEVFPSPNDQEKKREGILDPLQEKLKTSLFLSIIVLLIVVAARAKSAS